MTVAVVWWCSCCGSENDHDEGHCWFCKAEHGEWLCDCGRRNHRHDPECSECGEPRPEE